MDEFSDYYHVYPVGDFRDHILEGLKCWCKPKLADEGGVILHNSMDGREKHECGAKKH